jgi:hypothetical protein
MEPLLENHEIIRSHDIAIIRDTVAPVRQPAGKLTTRVVLSCLRIVAKLINAVVLGQHVRPPPSGLIFRYRILRAAGNLFFRGVLTRVVSLNRSLRPGVSLTCASGSAACCLL